MMQAQRLFTEARSLQRKGRISKAKKLYEKVIEIQPDHAQARLSFALILQEKGQLRQALEHAQKAMADAKVPDSVMLCDYGFLMIQAGQLDNARKAFEAALEIDPGQTGAKANLAALLMSFGRIDEAEPLFLEVVEVLEDPGPWLNLARIALMREEWQQAETYIQKAGDIDQAHPDVDLLQAELAAARKQDEKAYDLLQRILKRTPGNSRALEMLARLDSHIIEPDLIHSLSKDLVRGGTQGASPLISAITLCRRHLAWAFLPRLEKMLEKALEGPLDRVPPKAAVFSLLGVNISQKAHCKVAAAVWKAPPNPLPPPRIAPRQNGRKINVAFLSSDLRGHAMGYLVAGLFENLPEEHICWWAYNNSFHDETDVRNRLRNAFARFVNVAKLDDRQLAQRIRNDGIDVLIDLNGVTRDTRVSVMAWRPAPVQVTWMGMPGSCGAGRDIDYVIADPWVLNEKNVNGFSEHILQLPRCYQANDQIPPDLSVAGTRADHDLPEDAFVFCCFNQYYKFSPDTFALWSLIMKQVPGSVLWLLKPDTEAIEKQLHKCGIDADRIILAERVPQDRHIARLSHADLVLDTWPYNAHTTASDALRAGVPVLTLPGKTFASCVAASILDTAELSQWIAKNPAQYLDNAICFARQSANEIAAAKKQVFDTYWQSPMTDNKALGKMIEALCLGIYDRTARGEPLQDLRLTRDLNLEVLPFSRKTLRQKIPVLPHEICPGSEPAPDADVQQISAETGSKTFIEAEARAANIKTIVVLGAYSSGTTAVAGYLARLGAFTCPPHQHTNDPKTPDSYESKVFRDVLSGLVDEFTLTPIPEYAEAFSAWFPAWIAGQKSEALEKGYTHVLLKHPLAAFFIDDIQKACQPVFLLVTRPLDAIEKSRQRRGWHAVYGRQGAKVIYRMVFNAVVDSGISVMSVGYEPFRADPSMGGRLPLWTGMDPDPGILSNARKWVL